MSKKDLVRGGTGSYGCWTETGSDAGKVFLRASSSASFWRLRSRSSRSRSSRRGLRSDSIVMSVCASCKIQLQRSTAKVASARQHRCLAQKGIILDLLNEEIRHVHARDESACPVARIDQRAISVRLRAIGQDHRARNHPVELAPADDALLHVLVVIDAPHK